ncbi:MAG: NIPSNAP family protein [Gemmatimonadaceae bacterium]
MNKPLVISAFVLGTLVGGFAVNVAQRTAADRIFEIRTYTTAPGQLPMLNQRFRDHTVEIFKRHGMESVGYWVPIDTALAQNTLVYVLAHPSRDAARQAWADFGKDPEWMKVRAATEAEGLKVVKVTSVFATPTDYSAIK